MRDASGGRGGQRALHSCMITKAQAFSLAFIVVACACVRAVGGEIVTREVEYEHDGTVLLGYFAAPADASADNPVPGVMVVHEWWGHDDFARERAERIARELGYAAFAIDMYGKGILVDTPAEASALATPFAMDRSRMRARAKAGMETLAAMDEVDASRLASIGFCFGGTVSLELARAGEPLRAVVAFHANLATPLPAPSGAVRAKVLVCNGAADPLVPMEDRARFIREMEAARVDYQFIEYAAALHSFTNPGADAHAIPGVGYDERAERRSWRDMTAWLEEAFSAE